MQPPAYHRLTTTLCCHAHLCHHLPRKQLQPNHYQTQPHIHQSGNTYVTPARQQQCPCTTHCTIAHNQPPKKHCSYACKSFPAVCWNSVTGRVSVQRCNTLPTKEPCRQQRRAIRTLTSKSGRHQEGCAGQLRPQRALRACAQRMHEVARQCSSAGSGYAATQASATQLYDAD